MSGRERPEVISWNLGYGTRRNRPDSIIEKSKADSVVGMRG